jgi:hypothetical protein
LSESLRLGSTNHLPHAISHPYRTPRKSTSLSCQISGDHFPLHDATHCCEDVDVTGTAISYNQAPWMNHADSAVSKM